MDNVNGQQQINFQVPWELSKLVGSSVVLQVVDNGALESAGDGSRAGRAARRFSLLSTPIINR